MTSRPHALETFARLPGHLIRRVHQVSTAVFAEECGADVTAVQYAALVAIRSHPRIDATRLSGVIFFDRSTIGDVLDRLDAKGWVRRDTVAHDRRLKVLRLSPAGRRILKQLEPGVLRVQERLLAPLSPTEARLMVRLLTKVADGAAGRSGEVAAAPSGRPAKRMPPRLRAVRPKAQP